MSNNNKIENIDLNVAVRIIRNKIGYTKKECINENMALASFLYEMDVPCTFEFGEVIYIPPKAWKKNYYMIAHRDFRVGMNPDEPAAFHCWLNVNEKVLDIAVGTWTQNLPDAFKKEYLYGHYHNGFRLKKRFDRYEVGDILTSDYCHSYRKFNSPQRIIDLVEDGEKYQSNMTMYEDLGLGNIFRATGQKYAVQYRESMN